MKTHMTIHIYGRVQGVGFRNHAAHQARFLGIKGYVKNLNDGSVVIEAEGEGTALSEFVKWCRNDPGYSQIEEIKTEEGSMQFYKGFEVRY